MKKQPHSTRTIATHTQQERCCAVAKKLLIHFELKPELIDVFSKKQKQFMFGIIYDLPVVRAEKEKSIPRRFLDTIRQRLIQYMKECYFDKPNNTITYMEFATYGLGFITAFYSVETKFQWVAATPVQLEAARAIKEKIGAIEDHFSVESFSHVSSYLVFLTKCISQVNFRLYDYKVSWENTFAGMRMKVELSSQNCVSKEFTHNGIKRKAFRLPFTDNNQKWATVSKNKIFPKAKKNEVLNIYVQSHLLHRFKERVDIYEAPNRNFLLHVSLTYMVKVVPAGNQSFIACFAEPHYHIGYFAFFVQDDNIVLNTFIPLISESTPEGKKLQKLLPFKNEDYTYLGMDKLSFFTDIDFEQIPALKNAMIDSGIWETKKAIDATRLKDSIERNNGIINMSKTMFVKKYFDKIIEE